MNSDLFPEVRSKPEDDTDVRFTPKMFMQNQHDLRGYTVDVASQADSPAARIIGRHWTKADDGLSKSWVGERVWCNPPWSNIEPWVLKAWDSMHEGCELVDMLLPAWTDRQWWQKYVEPWRDGRRPKFTGMRLDTAFLPRMPFGHPGNPDGVGTGQPPFFCVVLSWRSI